LHFDISHRAVPNSYFLTLPPDPVPVLAQFVSTLCLPSPIYYTFFLFLLWVLLSSPLFFGCGGVDSSPCSRLVDPYFHQPSTMSSGFFHLPLGLMRSFQTGGPATRAFRTTFTLSMRFESFPILRTRSLCENFLVVIWRLVDAE